MDNSRVITIALAGNPNSGKTSLFNAIVGANQKVGNFSGVTVEKVQGSLKYKGYKINFIDLPGTYSLTAYSPEEVVARNFITDKKPDIVINVIDGSNLERNLYLTTQLMELEKDFIIALNMYDEVQKKKIEINFDLFESLLGTRIIPTSAKHKTGINDILDAIVNIIEEKFQPKFKAQYQHEIDNRVEKLCETLLQDEELSAKYAARWLAVKLFENDKLVYDLVFKRPIWIKVYSQLVEANKFFESKFGEDAEVIITENRHAFIKGALKEAVKFNTQKQRNYSELLDKILINRITGIPVFFLTMWAIFQMVFKLGEYPMQWIESIFHFLGDIANSTIENETLRSLLVEGVIGGVGGVLVFLPNIMLLFLALAFLEGTGYMARAAFVIDKVMHSFGLHGKSAISMITGFGCSVPAFMSTRTLKSKSDRITTLLIIPFMSCGAKLPVYILIIGAFFKVSVAGNVLFAIYLVGIFIALFSAKLFKATIFKGDSEPFVMELPPYRFPTPKSLMWQMWHKASMYLKKAATIILIASVIIWLGSNFPQSEKITDHYTALEQQVLQSDAHTLELKESYLAKLAKERDSEQMQFSLIGRLGKFIEPAIKPLGFDWRLGISLVSGIAGKEIVVSTIATIFSLGDSEYTGNKSLQEKLRNDDAYSVATAISFLLFVLLYIPCIAATTVFHREAQKWKYTIIYIAFSMGIAWIFAFAGFQITSLFL
ncbi:MAG: ferrous iron transport protein B [Bacteroidetes bacterium]|nr:ferrous iron transport protein B [Bacteroidota bacterium]MBT5528018.1 ferrous iron transport protein B [Cytophagia bacterium]MBT3932771.1 ferrous iron transport protein B [Bacteroidota bacterium]MBT4337783.1 ferrous iron transport protein B [Bacteroidota bacterium]MBT5990261.1 ferrous iron transport protein B [Bacteroidota bacterium]